MRCLSMNNAGKRKCGQSQVGCPCPKKGNPALNNISKVVDCFIIRTGRGNCLLSQEEQHFRTQPNLTGAIKAAGMAERGPDRHRHSHQFRIATDDLQTWTTTLLSNITAIDHCKLYDQLHLLLKQLKTPGIGSLTVYDTALRIGYFKKIYPGEVYLHAGTARGAASLGNWRGREKLMINELPTEMGKLKPHEVEDCLCICKNQLYWLCSKGLL